MSELETPLDLDRIDALLEEISIDNFIPSSHNYLSADTFNQVLKVLSAHAPDAVDHSSPKGGGSNLFLVLMYQNLLLAKRMAILETRINARG